jgi:hypothetical protein
MRPSRRVALRPLLLLFLAFGCSRGGTSVSSPSSSGAARLAPDAASAAGVTGAADAGAAAGAGAQDVVSGPYPASPYDGIYVGPSEAYVRVQFGIVRELRLYYTGNDGLMFIGARVGQEGEFSIVNGSFVVTTTAAMIRGTFTRKGRIDGTWQEGRFRGTWSADRISGEPPEPDGGWPDVARLPPDSAPPPRPVDPPRDAAPPRRDAPVDRRG